jgi:peptidoglycan-associated lipoprotein
MINKIILIAIISLACFNTNIHAQGKLLTKADTAFFKYKEYNTAIENYEKFLKKDPGSKERKRVHYQIGECYRNENKFREAEKWYEIAMEEGYDEPLLLANYGEMMILSGNYFGAREAFKKFLKKKPNDEKATLRLKSCDFALVNQNLESDYSVKNLAEINTPAGEFGCEIMSTDKMIFASTRADGSVTRFDNFTGQGFSDFYEATSSGENNWGTVKKLKGPVNTDFNDGTMTYDPTNKIGYFTQCNGTNGRKENCNVFLSTLITKDNVWSSPQILTVNSPDYSIRQPSITRDGKTMYFASDMAGGKGGADIWKITRIGNNVWTDPVNLGPTINTSGNEGFPFIAGDSALYFSSDGYIGYGGLDIYKSKIINKEFQKPTNIYPPFNSSADDFGLVFSTKPEKDGLFCSNRIDGVGDDDIYSFFITPVELNASGRIADNKTGKPIGKTKMILTAEDGTVMETMSENDGTFLFKGLKKEMMYTLTASSEGYFNDKKIFETENNKRGKTYCKKTNYDLDFSLLKLSKEEISLKNIYYALNSAELTDSSRSSLDRLVTILKETPNVRVSLNSHTDAQGDDGYNMTLSQKRAQSVVNYLVKNGIAANRLEAIGHGESQLVIKNASDDFEHQLNRRTMLKVVK